MAYGQTMFGVKEYIDPETGEVVKAYTTQTEAADKDFHKIWLKSALETLELVGNKKTKVAYWIVEHMDRKNELAMTYEKIGEETGSTYKTVAVTMKILTEGGFLQKVGNGHYRINPALIYKGGYGGRMNIMSEYTDTSKANKKKKTAREQLAELNRNIERLQQQAYRLAQEVDLEEKQ